MTEWTHTPELKIGDHVTASLPPPLKWWDRLLWRFFRFERERPTTQQTFIITAANHAAEIVVKEKGGEK